jgi:hypothetical protein
MEMDVPRLRAWYSYRQGLDGRLAGASAQQVLERTGWIRSVGSATPYLALFARAGISRAAADAAVAEQQIHELPSARACTYILPRSDFALGLAACQQTPDSELKTAYKLGVTEKEFGKLCDTVLRALEGEKGQGAGLEPEEIRQAVGSAARSLGEEGKKKGLTTTLPLALGKLQATGEIRRIPVEGRLVQQRFRYAPWKPNPLARGTASPAEVYTELARHYFTWIGPATLAQFQAFAGTTVKAAKAAAASLGLTPVASGEERLLLPGDLQAFHAMKTPAEPRYVLTGSLDGIALFRGDLDFLLDPVDAARPLFRGRGGPGSQLPQHAILDRGRLVGLWDFDPAAGRMVWASFIPKNRELEQAVARTEAFVRDELGDARTFASIAPRAAPDESRRSRTW